MSDLDSAEATLDEVAREAGISREEALKRAIVALAEENGVDVPDAETVANVESRLDELATEIPEDPPEGLSGEDVDALATEIDEIADELDAVAADVEGLTDDVDEVSEQVSALEEELDEKVQDLRDRVVQIYRDVKGKASEDHSHPALASAVDDVESEVAAVESSVDAVDDRVETVATRVEDLDERLSDDVSDKLSTLAGALVRVQRRLAPVETARVEHETLTELTAAANRSGTRKADCENCENTVHLALLSRPYCPHCESRFGELEPKSGFFGTATLLVGDPPALEGEVSPTDEEEFFDDE